MNNIFLKRLKVFNNKKSYILRGILAIIVYIVILLILKTNQKIFSYGYIILKKDR